MTHLGAILHNVSPGLLLENISLFLRRAASSLLPNRDPNQQPHTQSRCRHFITCPLLFLCWNNGIIRFPVAQPHSVQPYRDYFGHNFYTEITNPWLMTRIAPTNKGPWRRQHASMLMTDRTVHRPNCATAIRTSFTTVSHRAIISYKPDTKWHVLSIEISCVWTLVSCAVTAFGCNASGLTSSNLFLTARWISLQLAESLCSANRRWRRLCLLLLLTAVTNSAILQGRQMSSKSSSSVAEVVLVGYIVEHNKYESSLDSLCDPLNKINGITI